MKRLYRAICELIEAKAHSLTSPDLHPDDGPQGAESVTEISGGHQADELHADQYRIGFTGSNSPYPPTPSGDHLLTETHRRLEL